MNHYLEPDCDGGDLNTWMMLKGMVEASTEQHLDGRLVLAHSFWSSAWLCLAIITYADESLCDLGTFEFFAAHLFSIGGRPEAAVEELLHLIERL